MRITTSKLMLIACILVFATIGWSVVTDYTFSSSNGTYSEISGGTIHGTAANNEEVFNGVPIGFDFNYNSLVYSAISISSNGFIAMGPTVTTSNVAISGGATNNVIVPLNRDLVSRSNGSLMSLLSGVAPTRVFTVQWKNYRRSPTQCANDTLNFQIKLFETTNVINFVYGYFKAVNYTTASTVQCGLRGASNAEFSNRTTTTNWTNTTAGLTNAANCTMNSTVVPPNGLIFNWVITSDPPDSAQIVAPANNAVDVALTATLHWVSGGGVVTGYKVYFGTNNPPTNIVNGTVTTSLTYDPNPDLVFNTVYYWRIVPFNLSGDALNCPVWSFTSMPDPTVTTFPYMQNWDSVTAPVVPPSWTVVNANNDAFTWATINTGSYSTPNAVHCGYNSTAAVPMDDWLISPPLQLIADTFYLISFRYKAQSGAYTEKLEIKYGSSNTTAALTNQIYNNISISNTGYLVGEAFIVPTTTGTYYVGFHGYSAANMYALYLDDISIQAIIPVFNPAQNLTAVSGNGTVTLSWQAPAERRLDGYKIYRNGILITPDLVSGTTYIDNTVSVGATYDYYAVTIYVNPTGVSVPSNIVSITPVFNPPVNFLAVGALYIVNLSWQAPTGSTPVGYKVYRSGQLLTPTPVTALVFSDNTGVVGQFYDYNATAMYSNPDGESAPSNTVSACSVPPLNPPLDLTTTVVSPNVILNWLAPAAQPNNRALKRDNPTRELLGYKVYRDGVLIGTVNDAGVTTYTDQNLMPNTYSYTVSALYAAGESIQTSPVPAIVLPVFNPPLNLDATGSPAGISVTWSPPSPILGNLTGYRVFRDGIALGHNLTMETSYNDTAIISGVVYTYFAKAYYTNPTGTSVPSNSDTASGGEALNPVYNLQASVAQNNVSLTWTPPGGVILQDWIHFDDSVNYDAIGTGGAANFDIAARFTQTELNGISSRFLTKVRFFPNEVNCIYTVKIYTGGTSLANPGALADTIRVISPVVPAWNVVNLHAPIPIPAAGELRIVINCNTQAGYPAGCDNGPSFPGKGNVMFYNNEWIILTDLNPDLDYNWNIQGFVVNYIGEEEPLILSNSPVSPGFINSTSGTLVAEGLRRNIPADASRDESRSLTGYKVYRDGVSIATIPDYMISNYTDSGLENGNYEYEVTATYTNGESAPCDSVIVTVYIPVIPIALNESFEIYNNFSLSFGNWMVNDSDNSPTAGIPGVTFENSGNPMAFIVFNPGATTPPMTTLTAHTGQKMAACFAATNPPNNDLLITPRMRLGTENSISLFARSYSAVNGLERFKVGISTSENPTPISFAWLSGVNYLEAPVEWTNYTYAVPINYSAQLVRFGIKCESNDASIFLVDDVVVRGYNIVNNDDEVVPVSSTALLGNYPNPFNPETSIAYNVKNDEQVTLEIYNLKGEKVRTLVNAKTKAGSHKVTWLGDDENGKQVSSGVYFYRMNSGKYSASKKMILLK